jgi:hypothetical protein
MSNSNESRVRRLARREGYVVRKSRAREWRYNDQTEFRLIEPERNLIVLGERFDVSLDDIETWLAE